MKTDNLSLAELAESFTIRTGSFDPSKFTAFGVFRNESFYLPSFLDHHRSVGVEQFLIVDDRSDDGTTQLLAAQPDCVVLETPYAFGQAVTHDFGSKIGKTRAGQLMKSAIPQRFLAGKWALYLDADEYFLLPPGIRDLQQLTARLDQHGAVSAVASMVDFYPEKLPEAAGDAPESIEQLISHAPYFDARQLFTSDPETGEILRLYEGSTTRIVNRFRLNDLPGVLRYSPLWFRRLIKRGSLSLQGSAIYKTPLVKWEDGVRYLSSHRANTRPMPGLVLALAHFKLSADIHRRITMAVELRSYVRESRKYMEMQSAFSQRSADDISLLAPFSQRFQSVQDFFRCKLMSVPEGF